MNIDIASASRIYFGGGSGGSVCPTPGLKMAGRQVARKWREEKCGTNENGGKKRCTCDMMCDKAGMAGYIYFPNQ